MGNAGIEKRVAVLEKELASLRSKIEESEATKAWWDRIAGTFEKDPVYKQAMKMGREYRHSLKPRKTSQRRKQ